ncbi:hypothetical protein GJAV_G00080850 [Gymnothorax javanicus]|nr:hypothetical protein GJAV_G00080850 [Gymnothorax javanicus]
MARNAEKHFGKLNRLWLQKEREEGRIQDVHKARPRLSSLNTASAVKKWIPTIKNEIEYYLQQSQLSHYPERKILEFQQHIEELRVEYKHYIRKLRSLDPTCKQHPWTPRAYMKRRSLDFALECAAKRHCTAEPSDLIKSSRDSPPSSSLSLQSHLPSATTVHSTPDLPEQDQPLSFNTTRIALKLAGTRTAPKQLYSDSMTRVLLSGLPNLHSSPLAHAAEAQDAVGVQEGAFGSSGPSCAPSMYLVFMVDRGGPRPPMVDPAFVPCWSFPPAVVRRKKSGCERAFAVTVLVLLLLLILAALGLGAVRIHRLQAELAQLRQDMSAPSENPTVQRQIGLQDTGMGKKETRQAAHLIARIENYKGSRTLSWEPKLGRAFTNGVDYRDRGIQINETGLYFVYSRVEFQGKQCSLTDALSHIIFKSREGSKPLVLLEGHREGFCTSVKGLWSSSSYLGAVFQLARLDRVFVNVSHPEQLSHNHNANYFGLSKL